MPQRSVLIGSSVGLHARPASLFVQAAARLPVRVKIAKAGSDPVDARSILSVLALDARHGDQVILTAEGEGSEAALEQLATLLAQDLDSEEAPRPGAEPAAEAAAQPASAGQ